MNILRMLVSVGLASTFLLAGGKETAVSLGLDASSKAIKQWEKIFENDAKMVKMGMDKLSDSEKTELKKYLTSHAADSDHPEAAGL